jgi:hypothetical protein
MKGAVFFLLLIFIVKYPKAQQFKDHNGIDHVVFNIPDSQTNSTEGIARYIQFHFDSEGDKARAIYSWVTSNLRYDKDSANIINSGIDHDAIITVALKRRKGVCENFAAIFNDISVKAGLTSVVINGYTKQAGTIDRTGHSWCAAFIDKNWYLYDPTWDAGNSADPKYYMADPAEFIGSHMPYDPMWQLLNYPVSHDQFYGNGLFKKNSAPYFNFRDSIMAYFQMDSLDRFQATARRIQNSGLYNSRVRENYNYVKMHIEMINQDKEVELYNSSIADMNDATAILNSFIEYRNNQFTPPKPDSEIQALLDGIDAKLDSSGKKLDEVDQSKATLTMGTDDARNRLKSLLEKTGTQKNFLKQYLNTARNDRKALFY